MVESIGVSGISPEEELASGIVNALKRGETVEQAKASLLNAGYAPNLVGMAVQQISGEVVQASSQGQLGTSAPSSNLSLYATQSAPRTIPQSPKRTAPARRFRMPVPYWAVILMLLISVGIIVGAGVLGLYWHQLFPA